MHPPFPLDLSESRNGFVFRGGHVALDFTATLGGRKKASQVERLSSPDQLTQWLIAAGYLPATDPAFPASSDDLITAKTLRESLYRVFTVACHCEGVALPSNDLETLNAMAADPQAHFALSPHGQLTTSASAKSLLATLAHEAICLLGSPARAQIRQCEGEGCAILFLDTSRKGDRRWCSMSACGNKAKVAEHRRRKKAQSEGG